MSVMHYRAAETASEYDLIGKRIGLLLIPPQPLPSWAGMAYACGICSCKVAAHSVCTIDYGTFWEVISSGRK